MSTQTMETTTINVRLKKDVKARAMTYAEAVGIPLATLINAFVTRFSVDGVLPFAIEAPEIPNAATIAAMKELEEGKGEVCGNIKEMFASAGVKMPK